MIAVGVRGRGGLRGALVDRQECLSYCRRCGAGWQRGAGGYLSPLFVSLIRGGGCGCDEDDVSHKIRAENWLVKIDLDVHSSSKGRRGGIGSAVPESCLVGIDKAVNLLCAALLKSD